MGRWFKNFKAASPIVFCLFINFFHWIFKPPVSARLTYLLLPCQSRNVGYLNVLLQCLLLFGSVQMLTPLLIINNCDNHHASLNDSIT